MQFCRFHEKRFASETCAKCAVPICEDCKTILKGKYFCPSCATTYLPGIAEIPRRDPYKALLFSFFFPGFGQVYNGQLLKGLLIFFSCWLILPWLWGVYDAYTCAIKINAHCLVTRPSVKDRLIFFLVIVPIVFSALEFYRNLPSADQLQEFVQDDLLALSRAAEKFKADHDKFPISFSQLYFSSPPYLDEFYCEVDRHGYVYNCNFTESGYVITAVPLESLGRSVFSTFTVSTGGVLIHKPAKK